MRHASPPGTQAGRPSSIILAALLLLSSGGLHAPLVAAQAPTFAHVVGREFGDRITVHHEMMAYVDALAATSDRVVVVDQGASWEGRRLPVAIVTAPANHARLDEIRRNARRLSDPRASSAADFESIVADQPVIVWFGGSIHGFELSGSEGSLMLLEHLATRSDDATLSVLENAVILIDPMLNPDGRDAFAHTNHRRIGGEPSSSRDDWSNSFNGWEALGFRTGHYNFDTNRDWWAHTQRETQARVPTFHAWEPQVGVDLHEMGADVEFFFDPPTTPYGDAFPDFARSGFELFGAAYAEAFDSAGFEYMTRERYNYFYPGYTTSYHSFRGGIGMLFEQGSTRGLAMDRADGSLRRLFDAAEQQYLAAWTTSRTSAQNRERLLRDYRAGIEAALDEGRRGVRRYLIPPVAGAPGRARAIAELLRRNDVEVGVLDSGTRIGGLQDRSGAAVGALDFPAGTWVVEAAQPHATLVRILLRPQIEIESGFLTEARARVDRDENPRFYDITAWSLPLLFDVEAYGSTAAGPPNVTPFDGAAGDGSGPISAASVTLPDAGYAYLIDGAQSDAVAALWHLLDQGYRGAMGRLPFVSAGRRFASGTVILRVGQNGPDLRQAVEAVAERYGLDVEAVDSGLGDAAAGMSALGSGDVIPVKRPEIGLVSGSPLSGYSFGWAWHRLDQRFGLPATLLPIDRIDDTPLEKYDAIVLPSGSGSALASELEEDGQERLRRWINDGGTLVTLGGSTELLRSDMEMLALRDWYDDEEHEDSARFTVPGAMLRAELDTEHWLAAGHDAAALGGAGVEAGGPWVPFLTTSNRVYLEPDGPVESNQRVVARFAPDPVVAGHAWPESEARLAGAVAVYEQRVGRGRVIAFAEDPNFRGYWRGTERLFLNAVVIGPSAP
ncbi:MAG: M14 family zinc carboxypeptidase [Gemmatimonadota bacterium]